MAVKDRADEVVTKAKRRIGVENPSAADADGNVGTVRGALRAFGEGEFDQFIDALQEDVAWEAPGGDFPGGSELEGRDAIKDKFVADIGRTYVQFGFVPENFVDTDDGAVLVVGRFTGEAAEGDALDAPGVQIWQFGKSSEAELIRIYTDGAAFPELITEQKEKEREEEEKKRQEEEEKKKKEEAEADAEGEGSDDSDDSDSDSDDHEPRAQAKDDSDSDDGDDSESSDSGDDSRSRDD
jgi:ketosteroid isomerase-like protein